MDKFLLLPALLSCLLTNVTLSMQQGQSVFQQYQNIFHVILATSPTAQEQQPISLMQEWLESRPHDANLMSLGGQTPLIYAINTLNMAAALLLASSPTTYLNQQDPLGKTALHWAAGTEIIGIDPIFENPINELRGAFYTQQLNNVIVKLIEKGTSTSLQDNAGHTALDIAQPDTKNLIQYWSHRVANHLLLEGARRGNWHAVQLAMQDGANIDTQDERHLMAGNTPLHHALNLATRTSDYNPDIIFNFIRLILSYCPSINITNQPSAYHLASTAFKLAISQPEILKLFLETQQERISHLKNGPRYWQPYNYSTSQEGTPMDNAAS